MRCNGRRSNILHIGAVLGVLSGEPSIARHTVARTTFKRVVGRSTVPSPLVAVDPTAPEDRPFNYGQKYITDSTHSVRASPPNLIVLLGPWPKPGC